MVPVEILFDRDREHREAFSVHLTEDQRGLANVTEDRTVVYVEVRAQSCVYRMRHDCNVSCGLCRYVTIRLLIRGGLRMCHQ